MLEKCQMNAEKMPNAKKNVQKMQKKCQINAKKCQMQKNMPKQC